MFTIAPYSETYLNAYCDLYKATWRAEPYGELFTSEETAARLPVNDGFLYLLLDLTSDNLVGFVGGRPLSRECAFFKNECDPLVAVDSAFYISELGVHDDFRKRGFAETLTLFLMGCARAEGYEEFVLRTHAAADNPAKKLYAKLGFEMRRGPDDMPHGLATRQARIDDRSEIDRRPYYFKSIRR